MDLILVVTMYRDVRREDRGGGFWEDTMKPIIYQEGWNMKILGCMEMPASCLFTCLCRSCAVADAARVAGDSYCLICLLSYFIMPLGSCLARRTVRRYYRIPGSNWEDCVCTFCCLGCCRTDCLTVQEVQYRLGGENDPKFLDKVEKKSRKRKAKKKKKLTKKGKPKD